MSKDLDTILAVGEKIQQNWELRRKFEELSRTAPIALDGTMSGTFKALNQEIEEETKKLDTCPLWKTHLWPTLALELNLTTLSHQANVARTLYFVFKALNYTGTAPIVRSPEPLKLMNTTTAAYKEQVLFVLRANTYDSLDTIMERFARKFPKENIPLRDEVFHTLEGLVRGGKALRKMNPSGNVSFWKRPTKKYTKMKKFEWKRMIVEVLDMHSGKQLTHQEIVGAIKHQYGLNSPPESLHGSIGSALDRLSKDGKLKRFHRKKIKGGYVYWTTPIPRPLPLPLSSTERKR